jgi:hypothetical protein
MRDNNQADKQIEKEKEEKDCEESEKSEEEEEEDEEEEEEEEEEDQVQEDEEDKNNILIYQLSEIKEDYFLHSLKTEHIGRKIKGREWLLPKNDNDDSDVSDADTKFKLGYKIKTFNYLPLIKVKAFKETTRIVEVEDGEDSYTDLLDEGDSECDLEYVNSNEEGENENTIL